MSTFSRADWLALLERKFTSEERDAFRLEVAAFDEELALATFDPSRAADLTHARRIGSQTVALAPWLRANQRMGELAASERPLDFDAIRELNALVRDAPAELRSKPIHIGPYACPRPEDIDDLLAPLLPAVTTRATEVHAIAAAALLEQWLVTVHPFPDGNGRTARLAADWLLATHGYPPASYPDVRASFKAIVDHGGAPATPLDAAQGLLNGLRHTVRVMAPA